MAAIHINQEQFDRMIQEEQPLLVNYWAPWCSYCRRIGAAYDKIAEQFGDRVTVAKVHIDEQPLLAAAEEIEVIPTLVLYLNGKAVDSIVAPEARYMIECFLRDAMAKHKEV